MKFLVTVSWKDVVGDFLHVYCRDINQLNKLVATMQESPRVSMINILNKESLKQTCYSRYNNEWLTY